MKTMSGMLILCMMVLGGCGSLSVPESDDEDASLSRTINLSFQCGDIPALPIVVTGDARIAVQDFLQSNCSLHGNGEQIAIRCPQDRSALQPMEMPPWVENVLD